ncbi:hypothetical protein RYH80_20035 [Halobaculum sp. MBLA0147]|uniref:hypothetical protein n=1 Tax=Halobaculum sp. MBLA0147 TaxID=3079934 RepID=UPI0035265332
MTNDRATIRPVTLSRLVEATHCCRETARTTTAVENRLDVSRRRARETLLEATRIGLLWQGTEADGTDTEGDTEQFRTTESGAGFLSAIRSEAWRSASDILYDGSPHYRAFCSTVDAVGPATLDEILVALDEGSTASPYTFNETTIEVIADWAERLGSVARNAFTGSYYCVNSDEGPPEPFSATLLEVFDKLEASAGMNLVQRYLSIPRLREHVCERRCCRRSTFDDRLVELVGENVGALELSGAPVDTDAKTARYGIKQITPVDGLDAEDGETTTGGLVSTTQSTDAVMDGVEQFGKRYYYLAIHDREFAATDRTDDSTNTRENPR